MIGGRNANPMQQMIYFEEMSRREIPRSLNPQGLGIIAPSIRDYGTPEQQDRFLLPTLRAEVAWCLGMSEPAAGSDLASLRTRAVPAADDQGRDHFVVNGQKV
jgi:alkylation response protein AidB-like acyl-CoA dehydrogenase